LSNLAQKSQAIIAMKNKKQRTTPNAIVTKDQTIIHNLQNNQPHKRKANLEIHITTHHCQLLKICRVLLSIVDSVVSYN
jgi:hypothetical protein